MEEFWIKQASHNVWKKVTEKVKHAVVFMDNTCAECLFWSGGPMLLINAGAVEIKDFSSFESGNKQQKKALFVVSGCLKGDTLSILEDIIKTSYFDYCIIFTSADTDIHRIATESEHSSGTSVFEEIEEKACLWMGNLNYTCEVFHAPIFMAPYTRFLYLTPSMNNFFPLLKQDLIAIDSIRKTKGEKHAIERLSNVHFFSLPTHYQLQIKQLVSYFNHLFEILSCKEELFAVGHTSRLIATQLANLPAARQRRKIAMTTTSLLLVDRSLDLIAPARHTDTSLVDKILGILPELPGHCNNVSVSMLKLATAKSLLGKCLNDTEITSISDVVSCPGCLCPPDAACPQLLEDMITLSQSEASGLIKRNLLEACVEEGIKVPDETEKDNSAQIYELVESFHGNSGAIMYHNNLLQLSLAAAQAISDPFHKKWSSLSAMEKLLTLEEDPIVKIVELINEENSDGTKEWSTEDILGLLVFVCSLKDVSHTSEDTWDDLSSSLSLAISDNTADELPEGLSEILGIVRDEGNQADLDEIQDVVEQTISKLKGLFSLRENLPSFKDLCKESFGPPKYESLLNQLMTKILDPSKPDIQPDIEHVSTGLMDFLKSGFSMFKKVSQPRPSDGRVLFLFVVGGITFEEAAAVHKIVQDYNSRSPQSLEVIIGSTRITSPSDAVDKFLFANNLSPNMARP